MKLYFLRYHGHIGVKISNKCSIAEIRMEEEIRDRQKFQHN